MKIKMNQYQLRALIFSIRKHKANLRAKAEILAQAIVDKANLNIDTLELQKLFKNALCNRRRKQFYSDLLASVIYDNSNN